MLSSSPDVPPTAKGKQRSGHLDRDNGAKRLFDEILSEDSDDSEASQVPAKRAKSSLSGDRLGRQLNDYSRISDDYGFPLDNNTTDTMTPRKSSRRRRPARKTPVNQRYVLTTLPPESVPVD
jgi:hypothetical protein